MNIYHVTGIVLHVFCILNIHRNKIDTSIAHSFADEELSFREVG